MTERDVLDAFTRILRDLLLDDSIVLTMATRRSDVPNWDSLGYVNFIVSAETEFGIRFGVGEVESFEDIGAIVRRTLALLPPR